MNDLRRYFDQNDKLLIHKWAHYFDVYDRHFHRFRNKEIVILEIGVSQGGSLQMWKNYFGDKARIIGIDVDPRCKELEEENVQIFIGSQSDRNFLREVVSQIPKVDILIDDGGHKMEQQIVSFEELFDHIKDNGVYLSEDLHTSYWIKYGGGYKRRGTFIEYTKNIIDYLNAFHSEQKSLKVNKYTKSIESLHYYDSIFVIEKGLREKPYHEKSGEKVFERHDAIKQSASKKLKMNILMSINKILRFLRIKGFIWK